MSVMLSIGDHLDLLLYAGVGAFVLFVLLWVVQVLRKDAGVVDIGWTLGVGAMAVASGWAGRGWWLRGVVVALMGGVWAARLVLYILKDRILRSKGEDGRYQRLRAYWGARANAWFFLFFTSQSLLVVLFTLPFLPAVDHPVHAWTLFDSLAVLMWLAAMGGEWLADFQLTRFRRNPQHAGQVCEAGLWNYSRHPNYFFEWLHWWAYMLLAVGSPSFVLSLVGPLAMFIFLMRLTGIPHVEKQALSKRGEAYRRYQETTSMFIPWPKKRKPS